MLHSIKVSTFHEDRIISFCDFAFCSGLKLTVVTSRNAAHGARMAMQRATSMRMSMCDHGMIYMYILDCFARPCTHMSVKIFSWHEFSCVVCGQVIFRDLPRNQGPSDSGIASNEGMQLPPPSFPQVILVCVAHEIDRNR